MGRAGTTLCAAAVACLLPASAGAVSLEVQDTRLSINGYLDLQYTYMDPMPMRMGNAVVPMDAVSTLDQDHLNLILRTTRDHTVANINLESRHAFSGGVDAGGAPAGHGQWSVLEAWGEYQFSDRYQVRGGQFLAPFGIYNHMRYAISLFAPVVLDTMYEPPPNYEASGGIAHLVPDSANLMLHGVVNARAARTEYALYTGDGQARGDGSDRNDAKTVGAQVNLFAGPGMVGASVYWANDADAFGDRLHAAASLSADSGPVNLQAELLSVRTSTDAADVLTYYTRVSYRTGPDTLFAGYDFLRDRSNPVYREGMTRWSLGVGHEVNPWVLLKAEYHFHVYEGPAIPDPVDRVHMLRAAAIMVF
jgi:Gram-negative porin